MPGTFPSDCTLSQTEDSSLQRLEQIILFVHICLSCGLSYERSTQPLPMRVLRTVPADTSSFNFHCPLLSLRSSRNWLCLLRSLSFTSILPSIFPSIKCFRKNFLSKMWPIQLAFLLFIEYRIFLSPLTLLHIPHFSHNWSNWSAPSFSRPTLQNLQSISNTLSEMSKFQHHKKLWS